MPRLLAGTSLGVEAIWQHKSPTNARFVPVAYVPRCPSTPASARFTLHGRDNGHLTRCAVGGAHTFREREPSGRPHPAQIRSAGYPAPESEEPVMKDAHVLQPYERGDDLSRVCDGEGASRCSACMAHTSSLRHLRRSIGYSRGDYPPLKSDDPPNHGRAMANRSSSGMRVDSLPALSRADDGTRTRDPHLGKVLV